MNSKNYKTKYSTCPYNCWPINCGIKVNYADDKIINVEGNEYHDKSRGMLCVKGQSCGEIYDNKNRILHPLKRVGERGENKWQQISWEEALDTIANKLNDNIKKGHPEANALYHSHGNIVQRMNWKILTPRFANMNKITLWDGNFPCWYDVGVGQELTGYYGYHDPEEMGAYSNTLINWAQDPCASMANMTPYIIQLKERGGLVVTIDPRVSQTAALSNVHIRPRLGSDVILANAIANQLIILNKYDKNFVDNNSFGFEEYKEFVKTFTPEMAIKECEITRDEFELLVKIYSENQPLCLNLTRGALGKHWNGVQMVRAILCLSALSGNVGIKGGGVIWGERVVYNNNLLKTESRPTDIKYPENNFNSINAALENKTVNSLLVIGGNPLSQWPNINHLREQMLKLDLVVVYDLFLNHTAREVGDIILPATSWLEELGLRNTVRNMYLMNKVFESLGESKEASWWMNELSKRMGVNDYFPWKDKEECLNDILNSDVCNVASVEKLKNTPQGIKVNLPEVPYSDYKFKSASGKFEFYSNKAKELNIEPLPVHIEPIEGLKSTPELAEKYPLLLITSRKNTHFHSFHYSHKYIPTLQKLEPEPILWIHPRDAYVRDIKDNDYAELFNDRGVSKVRVEYTSEVLPGHVCLNDCWQELNVLTSNFTPVDPYVTSQIKMGGQPSYQNTLVEIRSVKNV